MGGRAGNRIVDNRRLLYRVIDANFNRLREGLRVCEEVVRFVLDDPRLTARTKHIRHSIASAVKSFPVPYGDLVRARESEKDVGRKTSRTELKRSSYNAIFTANVQRVKESLRVLEECSKLIDPDVSEQFKELRFEVYTFEKKVNEKLPALRDS
jgi:thiamine-phosphate pyrophosphorylase